MTDAGPLVQLRISLSRMPLRVAPAWSVLAGAVAVSSIPGNAALWLKIVAAVVLGDLAWGVLRQYAQAREPSPDPGVVLALPLPYAQPAAPLSRLLNGLTLGGITWHGAAAGVILAFGGALLLGWPAVVLSCLAVAVMAVAGAVARRGDVPAAGFALLDVLLPWSLGMAAVGPVGQDSRWGPLVVAVALTVLQWGVLRAVGRRGATRAVAFGVLTVIAALVSLSMPAAAGVAAVLLAPPLYWLGRSGGDRAQWRTAAQWSGPWLMLTLFVAALALR